jgi:hypothetical protein
MMIFMGQICGGGTHCASQKSALVWAEIPPGTTSMQSWSPSPDLPANPIFNRQDARTAKKIHFLQPQSPVARSNKNCDAKTAKPPRTQRAVEQRMERDIYVASMCMGITAPRHAEGRRSRIIGYYLTT